jgi:hypothetical protein
MPPTGQDDTRSATEAYYEPFYFMPAEKASDVSVRRDCPNGASDTCLEYKFTFGGANEWASAAFKPAGADLGAKEGRNIAEELNAGADAKIFLKFRARRAADTRAVVGFRLGGLAVGKHVDSIRPALAPRDKFITLTADWTEYSIDLTRHAQKLNSVVSPFSVIVQSNDNRGQQEVVFFVDRIRFVAE